MSWVQRILGTFGLGISQLRHERLQTVFAVLGVALAVLSSTLLVGVGYGVVETGEEKFDAADRDLWVTGGPVRLQPGRLGGMEGSIHDAHDVAAEINTHDGVQAAIPMAFQTVYAGPTPEGIETSLAVGVTGISGGTVTIDEGPGFSASDARHYAGGDYDGPRIQEVILDPRLAEEYGVEPGDTIYLGGTVIDARSTEYTVVGTSGTFSEFLGAPAVTVPLSELQTMSGTARTDSATMITVSLQPDANVSQVHDSLQEAYPEYDVRTNREQLQAVVAEQALVIASGFVLVTLGIIAGLALAVNILTLLVYQQEQAISALRALGVSTPSLVAMVGMQGLVIGLLGGVVGVGLTPVLGNALSAVAYHVVGFEGLVRTPRFVYLFGFVIAGVVGLIAATVAGWRVSAIDVMETLRRGG